MATTAKATMATKMLSLFMSLVLVAPPTSGYGKWDPKNYPRDGYNDPGPEPNLKLGSTPESKCTTMVHYLGALLLLLKDSKFTPCLRSQIAPLLEVIPHLFPRSHEPRRSFTTVFTNTDLFCNAQLDLQNLTVPSSEVFKGKLASMLTTLRKQKEDGTSRFDFPVTAWEELLRRLTLFLQDVETAQKVLREANSVLHTWCERRKQRDEDLKSSSGGGGGASPSSNGGGA